MQLPEAIQFIQCEVLQQAPISQWADLGCGSGLFSTALAHYMPEGSTIYAIDHKPATRIAGHGIQIFDLDFVSDPLPFGQIDGILMANSLHYVRDQPAFIQKLSFYTSSLIVIEYDIEKPVPTWVPFPVSYSKLPTLFPNRKIVKLGERPSAYGQGDMYSALITR
ncbi:class I SAM-dependent methyltransferase [Chitinophaga sancti]|uniref:Methyltransferase domain-containing protein n=1 Tax=Chitinophaga sancti TaxID=1004 RepID=A0A1K1STL6_9BACT|nr:methyltransferase domain-containing protein [Chitinophaga sancti]WQD60835.1 methyltransferase domain-containing protein [Chitinophaga sancti]WQG87037.1 methyltransferase domain-containing protein [Chitinophaga sancti]SFW87673.1 Methyltransferase domain-containing protein [Chitinophaga sancti]